ncbi:hypothetical protein HDU76_002477 [Blyttiomyces sp. JEL0837]|nr:hypothetical protein HDU76_002477 [Blyttiomyces sp. JEL0837]
MIITWFTFFTVAVLFFIGHIAGDSGASSINLYSIATIAYIGFAYPFIKGLITYAARSQTFWKRARKVLEGRKVGFMGILTFELRLHYTYGLMFGTPEKILAMRIHDLSTLVASTTVRLIARYFNSGFKKRKIVQMAKVHPTSQPQLSGHEQLNSIKATVEIDRELPMFNENRPDKNLKTAIDEPPLISIIPRIDHEVASPSTSEDEGQYSGRQDPNTEVKGSINSIHLKNFEVPLSQSMMSMSLEDMEATDVRRKGSILSYIIENVKKRSEQADGKDSTATKLLNVFEVAVSVLELDNILVEGVGIESVAAITSELIAKLCAIVVIFILLGFQASWSSCYGSIDLTTAGIKAASLIATTLFAEIPYMLWESYRVGYDLEKVFNASKNVKLGWQSYGMFVMSTASATATMMTVEAVHRVKMATQRRRALLVLWDYLQVIKATIGFPMTQAVMFTVFAAIPFKFAFDAVCLDSGSSGKKCAFFSASVFVQFRSCAAWTRLYMLYVPHYLMITWLTFFGVATLFFIGHMTGDPSKPLLSELLTIAYIGLAYPVIKGILMYGSRNQLFWRRARKALEDSGVGFMGILSLELRRHFIYALMLGTPEKILAIRIHDQATKRVLERKKTRPISDDIKISKSISIAQPMDLSDFDIDVVSEIELPAFEEVTPSLNEVEVTSSEKDLSQNSTMKETVADPQRRKKSLFSYTIWQVQTLSRRNARGSTVAKLLKFLKAQSRYYI